ncbi:MAG: T9SS type A sorting domain-containing protein [Bacteroidetes bacterium]|nr:MAG: T9SS type A sorting domain-containing protein [Bacteroidota bacterium]
MKQFTFVLLTLLSLNSTAQNVRDYAVELHKIGDQYPYGISWEGNAKASSRVIYSKSPESLTWVFLDSLSGTLNQYIDSSLLPGQRKDYFVKEYRGTATAVGYISLGHAYDAINQPKRILLLIDSNYLLPLANELKELKHELLAENWRVNVLYAGRNESVSAVKARIQSAWLQDTNSRTMLYLLGHIPVPYAGVFMPDAHWDHFGAWPADVYYGSFDTVWTDSLFNYSISSSPRNFNVPFDGKFDNWETSAQGARIGIGRVDFYNMPLFGDDTTLTRRYLSKAHRFRTNEVQFSERAVIDDNFGVFGGEAFASGAWRNFSTFIPSDSISNGDYRTSLNNQDYLFSYGCGGGSYQGASGIGNSAQLASDSLLNPFTLLFGSYFGDWDNPNNFLRAPLASKGWGLTNFWSGRPHAVMHHAALGDPIGILSLEAQKADSITYLVGFGDAFTHAALMGDPSLPVFPLKPADTIQLSANCTNQGIQVSWNKSVVWDSLDIVVLDSMGNWQLLVRIPGQDSSWTGNFSAGTHYIGIRGRNLRFTQSGSFYQYSQVVADSILLNPLYIAQIASQPDSLCYDQSIQLKDMNGQSSGIQRSWLINENFISSALDTQYTLGSAGLHTIKLEILSDSGCYSADSIQVQQMEKLHSNWKFQSKELCYGADLNLQSQHSHGRVDWFLNKKHVGSDSAWSTQFPDTGWQLFEMELSDELGCRKTWFDSIYQRPKLELSHGFSPVNHSICIGTPQNRGVFQLFSYGAVQLQLQLDHEKVDTVNIANFYLNEYSLRDTGLHQFKWTLSDSLCAWTDSLEFRAYPKGKTPMTKNSWMHTERNASLIIGDYQAKAHYYWGGTWNHAAADSAHKQYYSPAFNQDGNYKQWVVLEDSNECSSDTVYFEIDLQTGISQTAAIQTLQVYPNPNNGVFNYSAAETVTKLQVISSEGKIVGEEINPAQHIKLDLSPGMYTLRFILANGQLAYARICIQATG